MRASVRACIRTGGRREREREGEREGGREGGEYVCVCGCEHASSINLILCVLGGWRVVCVWGCGVGVCVCV